MSLQCPRCNSPKTASFHQAMKIAAAIGMVGGARGVSAALAGGQACAVVGAIVGPLGVTLGAVSGAILGGLVVGVGGCALGAQLGNKLDRHVLAHNLCLICRHRFNLSVKPSPLLSFSTSGHCSAVRGSYAGLHPKES